MIKRLLASLLVVVMIFIAEPLSGFVGMELKLDWLAFTPKASAAQYVFPVTGGHSISQYFSSSHGAIDVANCAQQPVVATATGTVIRVDNNCQHTNYSKAGCTAEHNKTCGNCVYIKHDGTGYVSVYGHLYPNSICVSVGQKVQAGQQLGLVGSSGMSTGYHLHFEIRPYADNYNNWERDSENINVNPSACSYIYLESPYENYTSPSNLGDEFYAYIGHADTYKWVETLNNNVQGGNATANNNQIWRFLRHNDGSYSILSLETGYAMDVAGGSYAAGANMQMMPYVDNTAQRFYIYESNGYYLFRSSYTDLWFDLNYDTYNVKLEKRSEAAPQNFNIQKCDFEGNLPQNLGAEFYAYIGHDNTQKWIEATNNNVQGGNATANNNQIWRFLRHNDGSYSVFSYETGYAMDVADFANTAGTNIQMMPYVNNLAQKFYIYEINGYYLFKSSYTDLWFDVNYDNYNVKLEKKSGTAPQNFIIQKCDYEGNLPQNLGKEFFAYIEHKDTQTWIETVDNNVQGGKISATNNSHIWRFLRKNDGSYVVYSYETGYVMDVQGYANTAGTNIQMMPFVNNLAQKFYIYKIDGYYLFKSSYTDLWFDVNYDNYNVKLEGNSGATSQRFSIIPTDCYSIKYYDSNEQIEEYGQVKFELNSVELVLSTPIKEEKIFKEWNTKPDGTGVSYQPGDIYSENADLTLYAIWELDHEHQYISEITQQPTCTEKGIKVFTCSLCNDVYYEDVDELGHDYVVKVTEPTCTTQGFTTYECLRCDDSYTENYIEPLNHSSSSWHTAINPTATSEGLAEKLCDYCGIVLDQFTIPCLAPDYVTGITLSSEKETVEIGDTFTLSATVVPDTAKNKNIIWSSRNPEIVSVSNGKVTAIKPGTTAIVAETEDGGYIDFCLIRVISLVAFNGAVIDNDRNIIYGLSSNLESVDDYLKTADDSMTVTLSTSTVGTGTFISVMDNGEVVDLYEAVVFGDVNGDSWYDGQDAVLVSCIANGMLTRDNASEAVYMAADCNHDGVIDQLDVDLLNQAGTLLTNVDQSKPTEVLLETSSEYVEYLSLIDQSPEIEVEDDSEPDVEPNVPESDDIEEDGIYEEDTEDSTQFERAEFIIVEMLIKLIESISKIILYCIPI